MKKAKIKVRKSYLYIRTNLCSFSLLIYFFIREMGKNQKKYSCLLTYRSFVLINSKFRYFCLLFVCKKLKTHRIETKSANKCLFMFVIEFSVVLRLYLRLRHFHCCPSRGRHRRARRRLSTSQLRRCFHKTIQVACNPGEKEKGKKFQIELLEGIMEENLSFGLKVENSCFTFI